MNMLAHAAIEGTVEQRQLTVLLHAEQKQFTRLISAQHDIGTLFC